MNSEQIAIEERTALDGEALDQIFRRARTYSGWLPRPIPDGLLHELYDLLKWAPTAANTSPMRVLFLQSEQAKARLLPALAAMNVEKSRTASAVAIIAYDTRFYDKMQKLMPVKEIQSIFVEDPVMAEDTALRSSTLQGAYLIIAARALGLDCGPIGGFDAEAVNREFFPDGAWKVNFICNLGYGDQEQLWPRMPRLDFDEACKVL